MTLVAHTSEHNDTGEEWGPQRDAFRVLIVDDDPLDGFLTRRTLEGLRPKPDVATIDSSQRALEELSKHEYSAALIDHHLDDVTGTELIGRLRQAGCEIPLILLTGNGGHDVDVEAMRSGASDYFDKNEVTPALLERAIRYAAQRDRVTHRLRHRALHDPLTGLANRSLLGERLGLALQRFRREGAGFSLLYLDLDDFKPINDDFGHTVGDRVLVEVSTRLREAVRAVDCVARVGGDEFVVLLEQCTTAAGAERVADELQQAIEQPIALPESAIQASVSVGASIGIVVVEDPSLTSDALLDRADQAMYATKQARRPRGVRAPRRKHGTGELAAANGERHELHYEPVVEVSTRRIVGYDSLSFSAIVPGHPAQRLLVDACSWAAGRGDTFAVSVAVDPVHLLEPTFASAVARALAQSKLRAHRLRLSLSGPATALADERVSPALRSVAGMGVLFDLDGFGTAESPVELLLRLPLAGVKIDRRLVCGIDRDSRKRRMLGHLVALAHGQGCMVTVRGVEADEEWEALKALDVDCAQGPCFGHVISGRLR